jgi:solute carrier family 25 carnitine/acylcarnitine transporter 20/29
LIYFISRPLVPPSDLLQTALPQLDLSSFLAAIFSTSLAELLKTTPRTTFLVPRNSAFKRLGLLVSEHLLAASSKSDLESVILHHVLDGVEYAASLQNGSHHTFPTLESSDVKIDRSKSTNRSVLISASGGWAGMKSELFTRNMLTQTGVMHELSDLMIPRSVDLTVGKLMKAAKGTTMGSMVAKVGMDWLLNGTAPPDGSEWADEGLSGTGWTLLCPRDDAFKKFNLTKLFADTESLQAIVRQHLIPTPPQPAAPSLDVLYNNRPLSLDNSATYTTLLSPSSAYGDIIFRQLEEKNAGGYVVGIKGARGTDGKTDWARVLSWGRSTTGGGTGGVIQIDRLLVPYYPPWWIEYGGPALVAVGGVLMIYLFFYVVRIIWRRDTTEATYEPVGGFGRDDDD